MDQTTELLSSYACGLTYEDLSPKVVHQVKRTLIDSLGCALGGFSSEPARIGRELALSVSSTTPSRLLGTRHYSSPDMAAFANGVTLRYLDCNDSYFSPGGGHAALTHTDLAGERDIQPLESVRIYHYAGTQHSSATSPLGDSDPATGSRGRYAFNCVDYVPLLGATLVRLDRWVSHGEAPPPSQYPRLDDGTAVSPERTAAVFQAIPGVEFPARHRYLCRLDFGLEDGVSTKLPPQEGNPYPNLVSAVDQDGNELGGIRLPELTAPLATQTGWNVRHPDTGGPGQTLRMIGSTIPFAATRSEREASGDPRLSIEERYPTRDDYLERVRREVHTLVDAGYLLPEDISFISEGAGQRYDLFRSRIKEVQTASG